MKLLSGLLILCSALVPSALAQVPNSTQFAAGAPAGVKNVGATFTRNTGYNQYYYWVVAAYPIGQAPISPYTPVLNVAVPSATYPVTVTWIAVSGASSYSVLRTTTPASPGGTSSVAVATGVTTTSTTDTGSALSSFTVNPVGPTSAAITLDNQTTSAPFFNVTLVNAAYRLALITDYTSGYCATYTAAGALTATACGSGGGIPGGSTTQVQYNNAGAFAGTSGATATATRLLIANGTGAAPGISFADGTTGFYRVGAYSIGGQDQALTLSASGVTSNLYLDNDSIRCGEGEGGERGICEFRFYRISGGNYFMHLKDSGVFFGDPTTGSGLNTLVGIGRASATVAQSQTDAGTPAGFMASAYSTATNCSSAASPAVCAASSAGSVVVAAAATTVVVNTTAVTANSQIFVFFDSSLSTKLGVTCNTTVPSVYGVTARTAATSFTITATAPVTDGACFSYLIVN